MRERGRLVCAPDIAMVSAAFAILNSFSKLTKALVH
jgi:hypothetical protein